MTVTKRQIEIIEYIMNNVSGITGDKLAKYFGVSSRTIRNDILQINSALSGDQLLCQTEGRMISPSIKASKRIGYYITQEDMEDFRAVLSGGSDRNHVIAPHNRGYAILGHALEEGSCNLYDLEEELFLSQTALREEVLKLRRMLEDKMDLCILVLEGNQARVVDNEEKIRLAIFNLIKYEVQTHTDWGSDYLELLFRGQFDRGEYESFVKAVKDYFGGHEILVSDASLYMVVGAIYTTVMRKRQGHELFGVKADEFSVEVLTNLLYHLKAQKLDLTESDEALLKIFLYSIRLVQSQEDTRASALSGVILNEFCQEVLAKYSFDLHQSDELFNNMALHLEYLIRRIDTGYRIDNPILQDIKTQYPYAYEIAILLVPIMFKYKSIPIRDEEIAYMALYVAYFLEKVNRRLKTVVISAPRQSVNAVICNWLNDHFQNQIELVKVLPKHQLEYLAPYGDEGAVTAPPVDLIISTEGQRVKTDIPVFRIKGIPNQQDFSALNGFIRRMRVSRRFTTIVNKYFNTQCIKIFAKDAGSADWDGKAPFGIVIETLSRKFKEQDKIETVEEYVDDVLSREVNYPTVIGESVMIPHPLMTFAKETAVAAAILKPPVTICKKAVKVIFLLAIEGRPNDDVSILFEFFKQVAMNENLVHTLYEAKDETDFLNRLISISTSIELF